MVCHKQNSNKSVIKKTMPTAQQTCATGFERFCASGTICEGGTCLVNGNTY